MHICKILLNFKLPRSSRRIILAQSMNDLIIFIASITLFFFTAGTLIQQGLAAQAKKKQAALEKEKRTASETITPLSDCTCSEPKGAIGQHCGVSPCNSTERLVSATCIPSGCGESLGIKEQECIEDVLCCDDYRDTIHCGTGGEPPDCPIGDRIVQKVCGKGKVTFACRTDSQGPAIDNSPSCKPHCIGKYSPNEAAAIANPSLPVICPGNDIGLQSSHGPWIRNKDGLGVPSKIIGSGITFCSQDPSTKCEFYCLTGYKVSADGLHCEPVSCQTGPTILNHSIANEELSPANDQIYTYTLDNRCPLTNENSYIIFDITLGEAVLHVFNHETSDWDTLSSTGDNNNLFQSIKLYPLSSDSKYFSNNQIQWKISQAPGDKDSFFAKIIAHECGQHSGNVYKSILDPNEVLHEDTTIERTLTIPTACSAFDENSHISVDIQLINANLKVYDTNNDLWTDVATTGKDNQLFLSLKYHPLGLENRYFQGNQISWKVQKNPDSNGTFKAGIAIVDCYQSLCSGLSNQGWVTALKSIDSCSSICSTAGLKPGISPEGMTCASGKNRPMSGTGSISYFHGCAIGLGCNGNLIGPVETHLTNGNCYRNGQTEEEQPTDVAVACYCE